VDQNDFTFVFRLGFKSQNTGTVNTIPYFFRFPAELR
jgi:hypothetical protein